MLISMMIMSCWYKHITFCHHHHILHNDTCEVHERGKTTTTWYAFLSDFFWIQVMLYLSGMTACTLHTLAHNRYRRYYINHLCVSSSMQYISMIAFTIMTSRHSHHCFSRALSLSLFWYKRKCRHKHIFQYSYARIIYCWLCEVCLV